MKLITSKRKIKKSVRVNPGTFYIWSNEKTKETIRYDNNGYMTTYVKIEK